ncbi:hypothetical protein BC940DRAFT_337405 [Gongronella butleri]|nr:hypothetical protein BC940DRAFT_337405 [Gongronella butleri]
MAFVAPVLVGASFGIITSVVVNKHVNYQVAKYMYGDKTLDNPNLSVSQRLEQYPSSSLPAEVLGWGGSFAILSKTMFPASTKKRLFFDKPPPGSNIRVATAKMALEVFVRIGAFFYIPAAVGGAAGRLGSYSGGDKNRNEA